MGTTPGNSNLSDTLGGGLLSRSFLGLLVTQFLGAWNDNMFRWLVVPIVKDLVAPPGAESANPQGAALALSVGLACFVIPYLLFAAPAGYLSDRFGKRTVIVSCKVAEIIIMLLGLGAIYWGNLYALFTLVFLMGTQSALFSPAKLGCLPEILHSGRLSAANGLVGLTTVMAVVAGTACGNGLYESTQESSTLRLTAAAFALLSVAVVGWLASLIIAKLPAANPARRFPVNLFHETWSSMRLLGQSRAMLRVALGISFFWALASFAQLNVDAMVVGQMGLTQLEVAKALGILAGGVGLGSVIAGFLSGGKVELGLVPIGAAGIVISSILLNTTGDGDLRWMYGWLFCLGFSGGTFDVPLAAYLQHHSPPKSRGEILAASNFLTFSGMLMVSAIFYWLLGILGLDATTIFLVAGIGTLPVLVYVLFLLPWSTARFLVWVASHTVYRVRVHGHDHLPKRGGALLVANHVTWVDGVFLMMSSSRPIRMITHEAYLKSPMVGRLARLIGVIPIGDGPKSIQAAIKRARDALADGELVCIFAEGKITKTGTMQPFRRGLLEITQGGIAPVIPVYLAGLWGSIFSFERGRFLWKWPRRWPYRVAIHFGPTINDPQQVDQVEKAVAALAALTSKGDRPSQPLPEENDSSEESVGK